MLRGHWILTRISGPRGKGHGQGYGTCPADDLDHVEGNQEPCAARMGGILYGTCLESGLMAQTAALQMKSGQLPMLVSTGHT